MYMYYDEISNGRLLITYTYLVYKALLSTEISTSLS